jgi:hypothetical protein
MVRPCRAAPWLSGALVVSAALAIAAAATPPMPATPAPAGAVIYARTFVLDAGFRFEWSAEKPEVREGTIVVIEADPALVRPRQTQEPILFVGRFPAQRISRANGSGRVVAFVPERVDLTQGPVWFGSPGLPEQIDAETAAAERRAALASGIVPLTDSAARAALARGGDEARFATKLELLRALHALALEYVEPFGAAD